MSAAPDAPAEDLHKVVEKLQHEKAALEKDLKKKNDLLNATKDKQSMEKTFEENTRMKQEIEVLEMIKSQNDALKDHMHQIASKSDEQRVQLANITKENMDLKSKLSPQDLAAGAAENPMDPIIKGFEATITELRSENQKLEESLKKAREDLSAEKKKAAAEIEAAKASATATSPTTATTTTAAAATASAGLAIKSWWGTTTSKPATPTPAPAAANAANSSTTALPSVPSTEVSKLEEKLKAANAEIEKLKTQVSTLEAISTASPSSNTNLSQESAHTSAQVDELKKKHTDDIAVLQAEIESLKTQLQQAQTGSKDQNSTIQKSLQDTKDALEKANGDLKVLTQKFDESQLQAQRAKDLESQLSKLNSDLDQTKKLLEASKAEAANAASRLSNDAKETASLSTKIADLEKSLSSAQTQINTLTSTLKEQTDKVQTLTTQSNTQKSNHEKQLQTLQTEKDALVSTYEDSIRSLQETLAKKSIELQAAKQSPSSDGAAAADGSTPAPVVDLLSSPEFELLKSGYEKDKQLSKDRIAALESKISVHLVDLEAARASVAEKQKEIEDVKKKGVENAQSMEGQISAKEVEIKSLVSARDALQKRVDELSLGVKETSEKAKVEVEALKKEHADAIKKAASESEAAHKKTVDQVREEAKKEKAELEANATKERTAIEEKYKKDKSAVDEAITKSTKELELLKKELADMKEREAKGSKSSEIQIKALEEKNKKDIQALEEKHKKEVTDLSEASKKSLAELESRLKKEASAAEEKAIKAKLEVEEKKRKDLEDKFNKEKKELEEKFHKEKTAVDEKHQREKLDAEEKFKKEKAKIQTDLDTAKTDIEKLKKDVASNEAAKKEQASKFEKELFSRNDEIGKYTSKIKTMESEFEAHKSEMAKSAAELSDKLTASNTTITKLNVDLTEAKVNQKLLQDDVKTAQDKFAAIQTKLNNVTAELEVARSSSERLSKSNGEKDAEIKKFKQKVEELTLTQTNLVKSVKDLEKDKDGLNRTISAHTKKISELENQITKQLKEFEEIRQTDLKNTEDLNESIAALKTENTNLMTKVKDGQTEHKAMEKRSVLIIKDLQKQLLKERKRQVSSPESTQSDSMDNLSNAGFSNAPSHSRQPSEAVVRKPARSHTPSENGVGIPKVERLTTELLQLAKENENLNKRSKNAEEEIRALHERLAKQNEELELKSKAVQQYMLREYTAQLQPEDTKKSGFTMEMLTSQAAMQKMNPALLSQVNIKMQKLLEELTSKMMGLEEENRTLKRNEYSTNNNNTVLKSSTV
ncbi:hypothetical protein HDU79_006276 [Rhizoclosmatium sp. JEL0117]|nr:hypothetical protein HDU79_006276 [Rhizoclosmatium sp. JEL0117]